MPKTIILPHLELWQKDVYETITTDISNGKKGCVYVVKSKRQVGKSILAICLLITFALSKKCISVCLEPTIAQSRRVFKQLTDFLAGSNTIKSANASLLSIEFVNGSEILFKSAEQGDALRGFTVSGLLVIDEGSFIDDEIFQLMYATTDAHSSPILVISTPLFMNGEFFNLYMKGINGSEMIKSFDWSKYDTSKYLSNEKLEYYRNTVSRNRFKCEYLGEFLTNDGLLFAGLDNVIGEPDDSSIINIGIDFGAGTDNDYTVLSVINNLGHMVQINRTNHLSPMEQVDWLIGLIEDLAARYEIATILCEYNSIGSVYIDAMKKKLPEGLILTNWTTTNKSKQDLVTSLQIAIENGRIRLLNEPNLLNELRHYQADINVKTKTVTYNGYKCNDDMVMATMFAYWAYQKRLGNFSLSFA